MAQRPPIVNKKLAEIAYPSANTLNCPLIKKTYEDLVAQILNHFPILVV